MILTAAENLYVVDWSERIDSFTNMISTEDLFILMLHLLFQDFVLLLNNSLRVLRYYFINVKSLKCHNIDGRNLPGLVLMVTLKCHNFDGWIYTVDYISCKIGDLHYKLHILYID
ncbi:hypothetical protein ACJX0J_007565, partial [Zea mays]